jgi:RNA polymerase sigma factor (sigma-70 family)
MEAVAPAAAPPDEELTTRTRTGDQHAFAALCDRHFRGIFDFALRVVRDRDVAADVMQNTFAKAWSVFHERGSAEHVKAWLYTVARNCAIDELRHRRRFVGSAPDREGFDFTKIDADRLSEPSAVLFDRELIELVWEAAAALSAEEYSLLDLHVRRDLSPDELADHLGLSRTAVHTRVARLGDSFDEAVTISLLATRGRRSCAQLDAVLSELGAERATQEVRKAVRRHLRGCEQCQESERRFVSPSEILGSFAPLPATLGLREKIERDIVRQADAGIRARGLRWLAALRRLR